MRPALTHRLTQGAGADVLLAVAAWVIDLLAFSTVIADLGARDSVGAVLFAVPVYAALVFRRRFPVVVLTATLAHTVAAVLLLPDYRPTLAALVALYTVAAHRAFTVSAGCLAATYAVTVTSALYDELGGPDAPVGSADGVGRALVIAFLMFDLAAWSIGRWVRSSREHAAVLVQLAESQRREAVAAERTAIARDMHDTVSNSVTAILLYAAGTRRSHVHEPTPAFSALEYIEQTAQRAMVELREMLSVLREPAHLLRPLEVDHIIDTMRAAGLRIHTHSTGESRPLPAPVGDAALRVLQEALTNSAKHSGAGSTVTVGLTWSADALELEVRDDGRGDRLASRPGLSGGVGLIGARERIEMLGGVFESRATAGGGYVVRAELPAPEEVLLTLTSTDDRQDPG